MKSLLKWCPKVFSRFVCSSASRVSYVNWWFNSFEIVAWQIPWKPLLLFWGFQTFISGRYSFCHHTVHKFHRNKSFLPSVSCKWPHEPHWQYRDCAAWFSQSTSIAPWTAVTGVISDIIWWHPQEEPISAVYERTNLYIKQSETRAQMIYCHGYTMSVERQLALHL